MTKTKDLRNLQEARDAHDLPVHSSCRRSETPGLTGFLGQEQVPVPETQHQQVSQLPLLLRYPCQECRQENMGISCHVLSQENQINSGICLCFAFSDQGKYYRGEWGNMVHYWTYRLDLCVSFTRGESPKPTVRATGAKTQLIYAECQEATEHHREQNGGVSRS